MSNSCRKCLQTSQNILSWKTIARIGKLSDNSSNKRSCMTHACEDSHNNDKSYIEHNNVPLESVERFKVFAIDVTPVPNHVWNECATHRLDVMEVGAMTCCAYDNTCK